ncbi:MAG: hypothetical protein ACRD4O_04430 [Bryobacteraceae bacterium]
MRLWTGNAAEVSRKGAEAFMQLNRFKARRLNVAGGRRLEAVVKAQGRLYKRAC